MIYNRPMSVQYCIQYVNILHRVIRTPDDMLLMLLDNKPSLIYHILSHASWGRLTHICVSKLTIIDSDDGLSPGRRQAIIWTSAGILFIWIRNKLQWTITRNSYIFMQENAFENVLCQMSAILSRPQCATALNLPLFYDSMMLPAYFHPPCMS